MKWLLVTAGTVAAIVLYERNKGKEQTLTATPTPPPAPMVPRFLGGPTLSPSAGLLSHLAPAGTGAPIAPQTPTIDHPPQDAAFHAATPPPATPPMVPAAPVPSAAAPAIQAAPPPVAMMNGDAHLTTTDLAITATELVWTDHYSDGTFLIRRVARVA